MLDILRIFAYTITSIGLFYCAIDDNSRGNRTDIVWAALAAQNVSVLALMALDFGNVVMWMETRYLLTPTAIVAAVAVFYHAAVRVAERMQKSSLRHRQEVSP